MVGAPEPHPPRFARFPLPGSGRDGARDPGSAKSPSGGILDLPERDGISKSGDSRLGSFRSSRALPNQAAAGFARMPSTLQAPGPAKTR